MPSTHNHFPRGRKTRAKSKIEQGDTPTIRELQEVKKDSKLKDQALGAIKGELERSQTTNQLEKVIEKGSHPR